MLRSVIVFLACVTVAFGAV